MLLRLLPLLLLVVLSPSLAFGQITIDVAPEYRSIYSTDMLKLKSGEMISIELPLNHFGDSYAIFSNTRISKLSLIVLDGRDYASNKPNPKPILDQQLPANTWINIPKPPSKTGLVALLVNKSNSNIEVPVRIDSIGIRAQNTRMRLKNVIAIPFEALNSIYYLPPISVTVRPCGQANAFSTPDIVVCSELIADLAERSLVDALFPILLHELAHSVLKIWNLPGYDNEDMADEFAAVFVAKLLPEVINDYIRWLESNDSVAEAVIQLTAGSRHTLSIQRARNMQHLLKDPDQVMQRWNTLLSPYVRR